MANFNVRVYLVVILLAVLPVSSASAADAQVSPPSHFPTGLFDLVHHTRVMSTWNNLDTLDDHWVRHAGDFGLHTNRLRLWLGDDSKLRYVELASEFRDECPRRPRCEVKMTSSTVRMYDHERNMFGAYSWAGKTRTFFKPSPKARSNPAESNADWWAGPSNPGVPPALETHRPLWLPPDESIV